VIAFLEGLLINSTLFLGDSFKDRQRAQDKKSGKLSNKHTFLSLIICNIDMVWSKMGTSFGLLSSSSTSTSLKVENNQKVFSCDLYKGFILAQICAKLGHITGL
jgi:hypothetical protein